MEPYLIRDSNEQMRKHAAIFARAAIPAFREAAQALNTFCGSLTHLAKQVYLEKHKRLPGGASTARLRKKRNAIIMAYFFGR